MFICTSIYIVSDHPYYCMLIISVSFLYLYIVSDHPYNAKIICFVLCSYTVCMYTVQYIVSDHPYYAKLINFVFIWTSYWTIPTMSELSVSWSYISNQAIPTRHAVQTPSVCDAWPPFQPSMVLVATSWFSGFWRIFFLQYLLEI